MSDESLTLKNAFLLEPEPKTVGMISAKLFLLNEHLKQAIHWNEYFPELRLLVDEL